MLKLNHVFLLCLLLVGCLCRGEKTIPPHLIWSETFDTFDFNRWTHLITAWDGGNSEFQYYRNNRNNSFVRHGKLHIRPTFTADEYGEEFLTKGLLNEPGCNMEPCSSRGRNQEILQPILSARIYTKDSFSFKYGRLEVRAKMPRGDWIWPAIWMMPEKDVYGGWPRSGEIDLVEIRANPNYTDPDGNHQGIRRVTSTIHYGKDFYSDRYNLHLWSKLLEDNDFSDDFHTFTFEWTSKTMVLGVDGVEYARISPPSGGFWQYGGLDKNPGGDNIWEGGDRVAPFDQKFYIILNVAVGGRFFPDNWLSAGKPRPWSWSRGPRKQFWNARKDWEPTWDRRDMIVDHILVYGWDE